MKITKQRLKEIIKEELTEAGETALNSPREAGRQWAYKNLADAVDGALGSGLSNDDIRNAVEEVLGPEEIELGEGAKPLSGSRVKRKSDDKIGYRTVGTKTGKRSEFWDIKWSGESVEKNVPRDTFTIEKDK